MFFSEKPNPFSSDAWNDWINPLAGSSLQPNPLFLTSLQLHHLAYSHSQKKPHFIFWSCATDDDLKQILGTLMRILGGIFLFSSLE
jgi:hypothetical protein